MWRRSRATLLFSTFVSVIPSASVRVLAEDVALSPALRVPRVVCGQTAADEDSPHAGICRSLWVGASVVSAGARSVSRSCGGKQPRVGARPHVRQSVAEDCTEAPRERSLIAPSSRHWMSPTNGVQGTGPLAGSGAEPQGVRPSVRGAVRFGPCRAGGIAAWHGPAVPAGARFVSRSCGGEQPRIGARLYVRQSAASSRPASTDHGWASHPGGPSHAAHRWGPGDGSPGGVWGGAPGC